MYCLAGGAPDPPTTNPLTHELLDHLGSGMAPGANHHHRWIHYTLIWWHEKKVLTILAHYLGSSPMLLCPQNMKKKSHFMQNKCNYQIQLIKNTPTHSLACSPKLIIQLNMLTLWLCCRPLNGSLIPLFQIKLRFDEFDLNHNCYPSGRNKSYCSGCAAAHERPFRNINSIALARCHAKSGLTRLIYPCPPIHSFTNKN